MLSRLVKALMLSAALVVGVPIATTGGSPAMAASQTAAVKLTAAQMLNRQRVAVSVLSTTYAALPVRARGKSTPFLKGLIDLANAYKEVDVASKARNSRKMGAALPKVATAIAKVNSAYQLSGIRDRKLAASLKSLNALWKDYLKVVNVGAPTKTTNKQMTANARKINTMRHELMKRNVSQKTDRRAAAQRAHMLALLKEADEASRQADQIWYASILMAEILGYYAGSYEYYTVYEPRYAVDYRQSWQVISVETTYFYRESVTYYEEYHWTSYEQSVDVSESYTFGLSQTEVTTVETQIEQTNVTVDQEAVTLYEAATDRQALETVETDIQVNQAVVDEVAAPDTVPPNEIAPPAPGTEVPPPDGTQPTDGAQPVDGNGTTPDGATPDGTAPANPDGTTPATPDGTTPVDACKSDTPPADCPVVPAEDKAPDGQAQPADGQPTDQVTPPADTDTPPTPDAVAPGTEDAQPTDGEALPDAPPAPDAVAPGTEDAQPADGDAAPAEDACAGDNPPEDCFAVQPDEAAPANQDQPADEQPLDQAAPADGDTPNAGEDVCAGDNPPDSCFAVEPDPATPDAGDQPQDVQPEEQPQDEAPAVQDDTSGNVDDVCAGDNPPADCFPADQQEEAAPQEDVAPAEEPQMDVQPEEQPEEEVAPVEEPQMEVQPEEQPQEEAAPVEEPSYDNGGDVCASDNPPAECFPAQQEEAAPQEEEAPDMGGGDSGEELPVE